MDWSKTLLPLRQIYDIYQGLIGFGQLSTSDLVALSKSAEYSPPLMIGRSLLLLKEMGIITQKNGVYSPILNVNTPEAFNRAVAGHLKQIISHKPMCEKIFPLEGLYNIDTQGVLSYWKSYVNKQYIALLPLLEETGFLQYDRQTKSILIPFESILARRFIETSNEEVARVSLTKLLSDLENKRKLGLEAERIALNFESKILLTNGDIRKPERISDFFVNAGYDIISFNSCESKNADKFIEVKAITNAGHFFLSRNEVLTAQSKKANYYLYLVDLTATDKSQKPNEVKVIKDPYKQLITDNNKGWVRSVESYRFEMP